MVDKNPFAGNEQIKSLGLEHEAAMGYTIATTIGDVAVSAARAIRWFGRLLGSSAKQKQSV